MGGGGDYSALSVKVRQGAVKANGPGPAFSQCALTTSYSAATPAECMLPRSGRQHTQLPLPPGPRRLSRMKLK